MLGFIEDDYFLEFNVNNQNIYHLDAGAKGHFVAILKNSTLLEAVVCSTNNCCSNESFLNLATKILDKCNKNGLVFEGTLLCLEKDKVSLEYLTINMPPIIIKTINNNFISLDTDKGNFTDKSVHIYSYPWSEISSLFMCENMINSEILNNVLDISFSKKELINNFKKHNFTQYGSFVFINKEYKKHKKFSRHQSIQATSEAITQFQEQLEFILLEYMSDDIVKNTNTLLVFGELILNAFEHGTLGISADKKQELLENDSFDSYLENLQKNVKKEIDVTIDFFDNKMVGITIDDRGEGFDYRSYVENSLNPNDGSFRGRGLLMSLNISSALFYSDNGKKVHFFVRYKEEESVDDEINIEALLHTQTVLYVEDDELIRESMSNMLSRTVRKLYKASNGQEGLLLFKEHKPSIVITDVEMPILDGIDMTQKIKELDNSVPVIVTTAHSSEEFLIRALNVGIDRFLVKPVRIKQLREAVSYFAKSNFYKNIAISQVKMQQKKIDSLIDGVSKNRTNTSYRENLTKKESLIIKDDTPLVKNLKIKKYNKKISNLSSDCLNVIKVDENITNFILIDTTGTNEISFSTLTISSVLIRNIFFKNSNFNELVSEFCYKIKEYLLDDEILKVSFVSIDTQKKLIQNFSFGTPPLYFLNATLEVHNPLNPPINKNINMCNSNSILYEDKISLLIASCGIYDLHKNAFNNILDLFANNKDLNIVNNIFEEQKNLINDITLLSIKNI